MKKTIWTIFGTLVAASLLAQDNTHNLPAVPPPVSSPAAETAPAAPAPETMPASKPPVKHLKKHKVVKHKSAVKESKESKVTLAPGTAQVAASELVVRGQAGLKGEVVARLSKGDTVNVLEQINLQHHTADEPSQWAKISFPKNGDVWIMTKYVNSGAVSAKKLNLRAGPGENYSVVGVIEQGTPVNEVETKGNWMKIAAPANAYAFVAARFLTEEAAPPTQVAVAPETPEVAPAPAPTPTPTQVQPQPVVTAPPPAPQPTAPPQPTVRIVEHQGIIGPVGSVVAPTAYKLYDQDTGVLIDFLYPTSPDQDLHKLVDDKVIVTGEEGVDARWPNTPVIAVQNIQIVGKKVIKRLDLTPPRERH